MKTTVALLCAAVLTTAGACRKKPAAPTPTAAVQAPVSTGNAAEMAASSASVMTLKLQEFAASNGRLPNDVTELDSIKSYGPSHRAPVGYKFVIDAKQKQVMAVKE